jgi:hypothetical protein
MRLSAGTMLRTAPEGCCALCSSRACLLRLRELFVHCSDRLEQSCAEQCAADIAVAVQVDGHLRTSDPDVYAIGDVAAFSLKRYGNTTRQVRTLFRVRACYTTALIHA